MRRLLSIAALLLAPAAQAQILSVYGTFSPTHLSNVQTGIIAGQNQYTSYWSPGFGGGITFAAIPIGPIHIGIDLRGSTKPGTNGADLVLGGIKAALKLPVIKIKPYIQGSVGYLGTRATGTSNNGNTFSNDYLAWEILGGLDYSVAHFVDFRIVEVGGGQGVPVSLSSAPNVSLLTVSTGIVLHF